MQRCPHCDSRLKKNTKFCPECGMPVDKEICVVNDDHSHQSGKKVLGIILMLVFLVTAITAAFLLVNTISMKNSSTEETVLPTSSNNDTAFSDDPTAITTASQSVVKVSCYDKARELRSTGSGFACFAENVIVTNYHVISDGVYSIRVNTEQGYIYYVENILAIDEERDIAILETKTAHGLELLNLAETDSLKKGEDVVAIGSPLGLLNSVSTGIFSGLIKQNGMETLQFTAPISSGSSGGALFNDKGEVLGVTFASFANGQNLNLAIPSKYVRRLYESKKDPVLVSDWFESNNGGYTYLSDSLIVKYQDLLDEPELYDQTIVTVTGYAASAKENIKADDFTRNWIYILQSQKDKTWKDEPSVEQFGKEWTGYGIYGNEPFHKTRMITCEDTSHSLPTIVHIGEMVTVTGWFDYDQSSCSAKIKLLYIGE